MLKQFKEFAFKGNLVDGALLGGVDFTKMEKVIQEGTPAVKEGDKVITPAVEAVSIKYGQFITDAISFILLAFVIFIIVKKFIAAFEKKEEEKPAEAPKQEVLLEQILEQLKK